MNLRTLLSPDVGVPIALMAMALLFGMESVRSSTGRVPLTLKAPALFVTAVLLVLVVARFVEYA